MTLAPNILATVPVDPHLLEVARPTFQVLHKRIRVWPARTIRAGLLTIVVAAQLPAASNHPLAWLLWATLLGGLGGLVLLAPSCTIGPLSRAHKTIIALATGFAAFAACQSLLGMNGWVAFASATPGATMLAAIRSASLVLLFTLSALFFRSRDQVNMALGVLVLAAVVQALWAMIALRMLGDFGVMGEKLSHVGSATGTFMNRNALATFLGMAFVVALAGALETKPDRQVAQPVFLGFACLFLAIALASTQSRMGMAATGAAALFVVMSKREKLPWAAPFAMVLTGGAVLLLFGSGLAERFTQSGASAQTRWSLYRQVGDMIAARPFSGHGVDSFEVAFQQYHKLPVTAEFVWDKAHSTFLQLWAEAGVVFGSMPVLAALVALLATYRVGRGDVAALGAIAATLLAGLHSLADFSLEIQANQFFLAMLVALGMHRRVTRKGQQ